jgi:hypothetical protein
VIHITKKGFQHLAWKTDQHQYVEEEFVSFNCLRESVTEVKEGVTLADIITFTARDEMLRLIVGAYSGCKVLDFYEELRQGVKPLSPDNELKYCTVAMEVEIIESRKYKIDKELEATLGFYGCGDEKKTWALDLAPLTEIAALPFRLEANATVASMQEGSYEAERDLKYMPNLLELLDAIFFDISFHGSPAEKADRLNTLKEEVKSINDGTAKLVPLNLDDEETGS